MKNTTVHSRATLEKRCRAVMHTSVAVVNVPSVGGAICFLQFVDKASESASRFDMNSEGEANKLLKRNVC